MTLKQIIEEWIAPAFVAGAMCTIGKVKLFLLQVSVQSEMNINGVIDQIIHVFSLLSAILGFVYLSFKTYYLIKHKKES